jgi:hypothetical protein
MHVDIPSRAEVQRLLEMRTPGSVSIYVPTTPLPDDREAARITLKNLASTAVTQLAEGGLDKRSVSDVEDELLDLVDDDDFWSYQARTLAVFVTPAEMRTYRLPNVLGEIVDVSDRFYLKPLLRTMTFPQAGFVLALAQGSVRLLEFGPDIGPFDVDVPGMPTDVASSVGKSSIADRAPSGRIQGSEGQKTRMRQYSRHIDAALRGVLAGQELPMVLAATEPLASIFRSVNTYPHLADRAIGGNPETTSDANLVAAARPVLDELYAGELGRLRGRFESLVAEDRTATDIAEVARAATFGTVETAFVDIDRFEPGTVDDETGAVNLVALDDSSTYGVVDEIARRVLLTGGSVYAVRASDVPGGGAVAAILRHAW